MTTKPAELGADIFGLAAQRKQHEYEVIHPGTKRGMGLFIQLQSIRSDAPQKLSKRNAAQAMKNARNNKPFTADELRANEIEVIASCVSGWRWGLDADGKPGHASGQQLEFTPANVALVLAVDEIREQLSGEINDEANFY